MGNFQDVFDKWNQSFISGFSVFMTVTLRNTDVALVPHLFLVFYSWILGTVAGWLHQQRSKYTKVKIMKHPRRDANYAILTKLAKLQDVKKPVSNLLSMQSTGFEKPLWILLIAPMCDVLNSI